MIPLSAPSFAGNEWRYIKSCLDTGWVSSAGEYVNEFERQIAEYTGVAYAVACVNGTSALQLSLRLAGVRPEEEVIVPTLTFIAPVNAIRYNGATPVFMDCDEYYNLDAEKTIEFILNETECQEKDDGSRISINKHSGKRIAAIVPVHVWGNAVNLDTLIPLCEERGIAVVEDASESLGTIYSEGRYSGKHTGTVGEFGCLSFNGNKIITTGGGGMILTDDEKYAQEAKYLSTQAKDDGIRHVHNEIGYNFRLTNIQAAMGVAQLEQLPAFLESRRNIHRKYASGIKDIVGLTLVSGPDYARNNYWLNVIQIDSGIFGENPESLAKRLEKSGIQSRPVWTLNHLQKPYRQYQTIHIEKAIQLAGNSLCLPSSINLSGEQLSRVLRVLRWP
jgi:perosamine synthetase